MNLTKIVLLVAIIGLLLYDAFVGMLGQPTESQQLRDWAHVSVCLPFVAGFLLAHWFLPRRKVNGSVWTNAAVIIVLLAIWDIAWLISGRHDMPVYRYAGFWAL